MSAVVEGTGVDGLPATPGGVAQMKNNSDKVHVYKSYVIWCAFFRFENRKASDARFRNVCKIETIVNGNFN